MNKFRFRFIPLVVTIALVILGVSLGQWQSRRALEKESIAQALEQRGQMPPLVLGTFEPRLPESSYRRVSLTGQFEAEWPVYLDNRPLHGVAGFYVVMPFKIQGTDKYVLIGRGWQPRDANERTRMRPLITPNQPITIEGVLLENFGHVMQLGQMGDLKPGAIIQNLNPGDLAKKTGWKVQEFVVEQTSLSDDGLQRDWPLPSSGSDKHRAYEFQWYALSLMAVIFFVVTGYRRGKNK